MSLSERPRLHPLPPSHFTFVHRQFYRNREQSKNNVVSHASAHQRKVSAINHPPIVPIHIHTRRCVNWMKLVANFQSACYPHCWKHCDSLKSLVRRIHNSLQMLSPRLTAQRMRNCVFVFALHRHAPCVRLLPEFCRS